MNTYIALLRGINVGGRNKIKMSDLKICFEDLGYVKVTTYIQSGNVIFKSHLLDEHKLQQQIQNKIREEYGFDISVLIVTATVLQAIGQQNPFLNQENTETKALHYTLVSKIPDPDILATLHKYGKDSESFVAIDHVIYLQLPEGYGRTKWHNAFFEKKLQCNATTRNHNTLKKLITIATTTY